MSLFRKYLSVFSDTPQKTTFESNIQPESYRWYGPDETVVIYDFTISNSLIYMGKQMTCRRSYYYENQNVSFLINPSLNITYSNNNGEDTPYYYREHYEHLTSHQRYTYLKWLAEGRKDPQIDKKFLYLFFNGLEYRMYTTSADEISIEEAGAIKTEVERLLSIYQHIDGFSSQAKKFLDLIWALYFYKSKPPGKVNYLRKYENLYFRVKLATLVKNKQPVPPEIGYYWLMTHPDFYLRTPAYRCEKEFKQLFLIRFKEMFKEGMLVKPNRKKFKVQYSANLSLLWNHPAPVIKYLYDPFDLKRHLKTLSTIGEKVCCELDSYSRYLGRDGSKKNSVKALSFLPFDIIIQKSAFKNFIKRFQAVCYQEFSSIQITKIYSLFKEKAPEPFKQKSLEMISKVIEYAGYQIAPHPELHKTKIGKNSNIIIFQQPRVEEPSSLYTFIELALVMCSEIIKASGKSSNENDKLLLEFINSHSELSELERKSLFAFSLWLLESEISIAGLKNKVRPFPIDEKQYIAKSMIYIFHRKSQMGNQALKRLEKMYHTLGLNKKKIPGDLHIMSNENEPVQIYFKEKDAGFLIPRVKETVTTIQLDQKLLEAHEKETAIVQNTLSECFTDEQFTSEAINEITDNNGLSKSYLNLLEQLLVKSKWEISEVEELCSRSGLFRSGTLEAINDWVFEVINEPLIEESDFIYINTDLIEEIENAKFQN